MSTKYYHDLIQGTEAWLAVRLGIITASQVCRLVTPTGKIAKNDDSRAIVFEKIAERITGRADESFSNKHMERGNVFEPFARDLYAKNSPHEIKECGFITREIDGVTIGYSPDGLVGDDGLIEIKCPARTKHVREICQNKPPSAYMMQMQAGMLITGRTWCDYIGHHNGMAQRVIRVLPDHEMFDLIIEATAVFEKVVIENMEIYTENVKHMHVAPFIDGDTYE